MVWRATAAALTLVALGKAGAQDVSEYIAPLGATDPASYTAWLSNISSWAPQAAKALDYNVSSSGSVYNGEVAEWMHNTSSYAHVMVYDRGMCSDELGCGGNFTTGQYLRDLAARLGPVDVVVLWWSSPFLGLDSRNQFQLLADGPGGTSSVDSIIATFHGTFEHQSASVLLGVTAGDHSTAPPNEADDFCLALTAVLDRYNFDGAYAPGAPWLPQECAVIDTTSLSVLSKTVPELRAGTSSRQVAIMADGPLGPAPPNNASLMATNAITRLRWTGGGPGFPPGSVSDTQPLPFQSYRLIEPRHDVVLGSEFDEPGDRLSVIQAALVAGSSLSYQNNVYGQLASAFTDLERALLHRATEMIRFVRQVLRTSGPPVVVSQPSPSPSALPTTTATPTPVPSSDAPPDSEPAIADIPVPINISGGTFPAWVVEAEPANSVTASQSTGSCPSEIVGSRTPPSGSQDGNRDVDQTSITCTVWLFASAVKPAVEASLVINASMVKTPASLETLHFFDLYRGVEVQPDAGTRRIFSLGVEPGGIGGLLAIPLVSTSQSPHLEAFLALMSNLTKTPLSSFSNAPKIEPQQWTRPAVAPPAASTPKGMLLLPGVAGYTFESTHILPPTFSAADAVATAASTRAGTGTQYPWLAAPASTVSKVISVAPFYMDIDLVTNKDFMAYCQATKVCIELFERERREGSQEPTEDNLASARAGMVRTRSFLRHWNMTDADGHPTFPQPLANAPVTYVSRSEALGYAAWAGKRLPTEWEWQYAAQATRAAPGVSARLYPWGDTPCTPGEQCPKPATSRTANATDLPAVGKYAAGNSDLGFHDLSGLVWQMTDRYCDSVTCATLIKGGSIWQPPDSSGVLFGNSLAVNKVARIPMFGGQSFRSDFVGFRCVKDSPL